MANHDDEELSYVSTSPFLNAPTEVKSQDEADLPALKRIKKITEEKIKYFNSNEALTTDENLFTVKQQLAVTQMVIMHLKEVQGIYDKTINDIREKYRE